MLPSYSTQIGDFRTVSDKPRTMPIELKTRPLPSEAEGPGENLFEVTRIKNDVFHTRL